jgi:hypothetical protein
MAAGGATQTDPPVVGRTTLLVTHGSQALRRVDAVMRPHRRAPVEGRRELLAGDTSIASNPLVIAIER